MLEVIETFLHKEIKHNLNETYPLDLAVKRDGSIYFTDPPYGFKNGDKDEHKAQEQNGIYRYNNGSLTMLSTDYR